MAESFDHLRTICEAAISDGVVPGLSVVVGGPGGKDLYAATFGKRQLVPAAAAAPAGATTMWDLASLTKPLVTSVLAMQAVAEGALELDEPLGTSDPAVTVRRALAHATGLPAHRKFYADVLGAGGAGAGAPAVREAVVRAARETPASYPAGSRSLYSDLGFILLGDLLERRLGDRLDRLTHARITGPLGVAGALGFRPIGETPVAAAGADIAATEDCPVRGRILVGEVHDLNAYAMGGVAGHAGLFGTAAAVATVTHALCATYLGAGGAPGAGGARHLVDRELLRLFWSPAGVPGSNWRLGWDGPSAVGSLAGDRISRAGVGHLAFTGCSVWIDPARACFVVMLSNRVHPSAAEHPGFRPLRRALNDAGVDGCA